MEAIVSIAAAAICTGVLCFWWWYAHPAYGKNNGGRVYPIVGSLPSLLRNKHRLYEWTTELLARSPSLTIRAVMFGIQLITTADPANVEHILKANFRNYPKGHRFRLLMCDMLGDGIFNSDGDTWRAQRKVSSLEFTSASLKSFVLETVKAETSSRLLPVLDSIAANGSLVDLQDLLLRFTFDNVCQISLGADPHCLNPSLHNVPFAEAFDVATELITQRFFTPAWLWRLKRTLNLGSERHLREALKVVHGFAMDVISKRKQEVLLLIAQSKEKKGDVNVGRKDLLFRFMSLAEMQSGFDQYNVVDWNHKASNLSDANYISEAVSKQLEEVDPGLRRDMVMNQNGADARSDELLRDMVISFLLAGRDTSSIALSWFFWLLSQHPRVENAIYEEINTVLRERKAVHLVDDNHDQQSSDEKRYNDMRVWNIAENKQLHGTEHPHQSVDGSISGDDYTNPSTDDSNINGDDPSCMNGSNGRGLYTEFTYEELKRMQWLHAAIHEAQRLYPPVPHDTKLALEDDVLPDGTRISKHTQVNYHPYAMGRMERLWGADCREFKPERWLIPSPNRGLAANDQECRQSYSFVQESPFKYPIFQAGPRVCLGKEMAVIQMKYVAASLIHRFTFQLPPAYTPTYSLSLTLKIKNGLPLYVSLRQKH